MQAALAPLLAAPAAAGAGAAAAGSSMLLTNLALGSAALAPVFTGLAGRAQAKGEEMRARANAEIGRTRAAQTDTTARQDLNSELATLRTTLATNAQPMNTGTAAIFNELRRTRSRERRITTGNEMRGAADWSMAASNARAGGRNALLGGFIQAAPSMFDLAQTRRT